MRLTQWTDYTLRVLMYCAASQERELPVTITEIADSHGISRSHLTKIVQELSAQGLLETTRGRGGGCRGSCRRWLTGWPRTATPPAPPPRGS